MKIRVIYGKETSDVEEEWAQLASTASKNPRKSEAEQVDWVIAELQKRVQVNTRDGTSARQSGPRKSADEAQAHKSQRRLFADTTAMPNNGGIPKARIDWLEVVFKKHQNYSTPADEKANEVHRIWAVNYIA
ncbi:MAG: hypothetical protein Q9183_007229, partial [Haloplaca sp. 2 TL-2023]